MGDFRFSFKATFSMGDYQDEADMNLNYAESIHVEDMDDRVLEWMQKCFREGQHQIRQSMMDGAAMAAEDDERREYERLKAKFEPPHS